MTPHILVTGATGFVGTHMVQQALRLGWNVDGLKRADSATDLAESINQFYEGVENPDMALLSALKADLQPYSDLGGYYSHKTGVKKGTFQWIEGDALDVATLCDILAFPYDYIIDTAALISFKSSEEEETLNTNQFITRNVVNACLVNKRTHLVHVSSIAALGRPENNEPITINETWTDSRFNTPYALSKQLSEMEVWRGAHEGLNVLIVNPGVILGYHPKKTSSTQIINAANGLNPIVPQGSNGFIFVEDLVFRTLELLKDEGHWNCRHLMVSHNVAFMDLFKAINKVSHKSPYKFKLKNPLFSFIYTLLWILEFLRFDLPISTHLLKSTKKKSIYDNRIGHTQSRKFA